ncbi:MAG: hypothetical protein HY554_02035 [Elusimicrobia bacterium]|nr:hypothetical protein [Elusimicrobiota bacterium]
MRELWSELKDLWADRANRLALAAGFALSLAFNWLGVLASIDKAPVAELLLPALGEAEGLRDRMVELRQKLYQARYATGDDNIILANERQARQGRAEEHVELVLEGRKVRLSESAIAYLRAFFLLHPYSETDSIHALQRMRSQRSVNPHLFQYGGGFLYFMGAAIFLAGKLGVYRLTSDVGFYIMNPAHISAMYASAAWAIGLVAALVVIPASLIARTLWGRTAAILAPLVCGAMPLFAVESHFLKPFSYAAPWMLLALHLIFRLGRPEPRTRDYVLAGLFSGLSVGCLYLTWFLPLAIALMHAQRARRPEGWRPVLLAALGFAAGLVAFNPSYVLSPGEFLGELSFLSQRAYSSTAARVLPFFIEQIPAAMSWPLWLLALGGLALALRERIGEDRVLLTCAGLFAAQTILTHGTAHYAAPLFPVLALWAARSAAHAVDSGWPGARALVAAALGFGLLQQAFYASLFRQPEPGFTAAAWVHQNVPAGASLALVRDAASKPFAPVRLWRYEHRFPIAWIPDESEAGPDSGPPPQYALVSRGLQRGGPVQRRLRFRGADYERLDSFERRPFLGSWFRATLIDYMDWRYYVYRR